MQESNKPLPNRRYITLELAIDEFETFCYNTNLLGYEPVIDFVQNYLDLLPRELHNEYRERVYKMLELEFKGWMPVKSDILRIDLELEKRIGLYGRTTSQRSERRVKILYPQLRMDKSQSPAIITSKIDVQEIIKEVDEPTSAKDLIAFNENTVNEYLEHFKGNAINAGDYDIVANVLSAFFNEKPLPKYKPVFVKRGNKTKLAYALGNIFRDLKSEVLSYQYLELCKGLFACYSNEIIDKAALNKGNLYKYFTTKTQQP